MLAETGNSGHASKASSETASPSAPPPLSRLKRAILGDATPAPTSDDATPPEATPSMTEIIVTVDSEGAIMGVDGAASETQTYYPVKGGYGWFTRTYTMVEFHVGLAKFLVV